MFGRGSRVKVRVHTTPVPLDARAARLASLLTEGLEVQVTVQHLDDNLVFVLLDRDGRPLRNDRGLEGGELRPIHVAFVPADQHEPIMAFFEPVSDTTVGYAGNGGGSSVEEVGATLVRHYRAAVDPAAPPWSWGTPWGDTDAG